ncbi:MAG: hypothetical protein GY942_03650, partial [Aestuariibacter sp.]|nr:hypothetical protein [Aestuariibacter sp.]
MADTYQVPQASDAVTAYAPGFKTGHLFDVPAVSNGLAIYAPEFSAQQVDRYVVPEAVCDLTVTAPIFYTSETVTAGCYAVWLYIDGVDVTQYLAGGVQVTEKENASTLAGFDLTFGPTVSPGQVFQFVVYDGTNTKALFVGKLSKCEPQPDSGIITCSATNDLQNAVRDLTEDELNTLTGGYFHKEISRTEGDRWERFQQLLETVPKESHICHDGALVCVDWAAKGTADVQHTNATRYTKTLRGTVAQSSGIVNRNRVTVQHTFKRRKLRTIGCSWNIPHHDNIRYYLDHSWPLPNQDAARSALDGCGWEVKNLSFTPPWHHYHFGDIYRYNDYSGGTLGQGGIVIDWADDLIIGFSATLAKTWDQTHINDYVFDVRSNTSITALGERGVDEHWGLSEAEQAEVVEETTGHGALYTSGRSTQAAGSVIASGSDSELEAGQELSNGDWYYDDINAETDLEGAIATAVNRATTEILATHRDHSEYFEVPFSHANTLANTTRLVGDVTCKGKNRSLVH